MFDNKHPGEVYEAANKGHSGTLAYKWLDKPLRNVQLTMASGRDDFNLYGTLEYKYHGTTQNEAQRKTKATFEKVSELLSKQAITESFEPYEQDSRLIFEAENGTPLALGVGSGEHENTQLQITTGYLEKDDGSRQVILSSLELEEAKFKNALSDILGALAVATEVTYKDIARRAMPEYSIPVTPPNPKTAEKLPEAQTQNEAQEESLHKPEITFEDIGGQEELKQELKKLAAAISHPEVYKSWGAKPPKGLLFHGPPGTGKTMAARALAAEAGVPFFSASGSEFVEQFVGVGASRVRDLFTKAKENAPCIVFIDEIDGVGRQRGSGGDGGSDEYAQTLDQLLTEMDGFEQNTNVTVVASTNRRDVLDPALLRPGRFDKELEVGMPDAAGRRHIFEIHSKKATESAGRELFEANVNLEEVARQSNNFNGADIAEVVRRVLEEKAYQEIQQGFRPPAVNMQEILDGLTAVRREKTSSSHRRAGFGNREEEQPKQNFSSKIAARADSLPIS